jgi:hypothetical protein
VSQTYTVPLDDRVDRWLRNVGDGFVCVFAAWTVAAHAVVWSDHPFALLRRLSPVAFAVGVAFFVWTRRRPASEPSAPVDSGNGEPADGSPVRGRAFVLPLSAAVAVGMAWAVLPPALAWASSIVALAVIRAGESRGEALAPARAATTRGDVAVLALATAVAVAATLFTHRPDADDCLYLNMAVSVLDAPDAPIFASDTLQRIPGGIYLPTYRFHSLELLFALLAGLFRTEPIVVAHLLLPPVFSAIAVAGIARLARVLVGRRWALATAATVALLLLARGSHMLYGNFAFVRMFQGKAVFVTALVPIIVVLALEQLDRSGRRSWTLLALSQIAAIGLTANAIYVAPLAAGLALAAGTRPRLRDLVRITSALLACFYPVLAGLLLLSRLHALGVHMEEASRPQRLPETLQLYFGSPLAEGLWLSVLVVAPAAFTGGRRRWAAGLGLLFVGLFLCPWLDAFWARTLTGPHLLWRMFWAVPLPLLFAASLLLLFRIGQARSGPALGGALLLAGLVAVALTGGASRVVDLGLGWPSLKVEPGPYRMAAFLVATSPPGAQVLACREVADWVPTFRHHPSLVASREIYLEPMARLFPEWAREARLAERLRLRQYVSAGPDRIAEAALLAAWLERGEISAVVLAPSIPASDPVHAVLRDHAFAPAVAYGYLVYRPVFSPAPQNQTSPTTVARPTAAYSAR